MTPAQPPFPTDWSLLFHPDAGSQTSILISESLEGVRVAVTRQNEGRWAKGEAEGCAAGSARTATGGVKAPAATSAADVICVCGSERWDRLSHDAAIAVEAPNVTVTAKTKKNARIIGRNAALLANMATPPGNFTPAA